jgi:hypothetical protein
LNRRDKLWMIGVAGTTTTVHSLPLPQLFTPTKMDSRSNFLSKQAVSMPKIAKLMQFKSKNFVDQAHHALCKLVNFLFQFLNLTLSLKTKLHENNYNLLTFLFSAKY